jgi:hypothetical protein
MASPQQLENLSKITDALKHIAKNWKTTLSGILTGVIGLSAAVVAPNPWISSAIAGKILGAGVIAKVILGMIQKDGGNQVNVNLPAGAAPMKLTIPPGSEVKQDTTITTPS